MKRIVLVALAAMFAFASCEPESEYKDLPIDYETYFQVGEKLVVGTDDSGAEAVKAEFLKFALSHVHTYLVKSAPSLESAYKEADNAMSDQLEKDAKAARELFDEIAKKLEKGTGYGDCYFLLSNITIERHRLLGLDGGFTPIKLGNLEYVPLDQRK